MLCLIYCLWIVMMAHKSKKLLFSFVVQFDLCFSFFFSLGKVIFLLVITRWCSIWKFVPTSHSPSFIIYFLYRYTYVYVYVLQSHIIAHSFCLYWRKLQDASLYLIDDEVLLSFIHKWSVCVMKEKERERKVTKSCDDTLHRSFVSFFFLFNRSSDMYNISRHKSER
jgi:hypothetical protein